MDHRSPLKLHTVLAFEGMPCHIEEVIGQGSNAIVYKGWYQDSLDPDLRHHVLVKELFPFHPQKKIFRGDDGSILVEPEAQDLWQTHRESFEIGNRVHLRLLYDHPDLMVMGANLNSFHFNGTLYSVLGYTGGRSLQAELNRNTGTLNRTARRMIGLLDALEAFHKSGYLHLDISPDNIMLVGQEDREQIFLIDYNSARELGSRDSSYLSCKAGYSAPEVSTGNLDAIGFSSDLYSVAAVFFRCLMGRSLTLAEMLQPKAPDCQDSPLLKDVPQTVSSMVSTILKKSLHTLSRRRYQSIGQMRQAFQELLDRIDCVGVTHWSLWENGKRSVEELIRINPSLRYVKEENKLYPIRLEQEYSMSLNNYVTNLLSPEGKSGMILAQGGMGKTTLLLHTAMLQGKRYSAATPAVFYISLNSWDQADTRYIRSQILMRLRFRKEENTFDSAMHALHQLLEQPIRTKQGDIPTVLLLLDGLNEVRGDIAPLVQEINELSKLAGVRILAASRSQVPELELETATLMPLNVEDIEDALGRNGLLIPRKQEVIQLLRTPLILSIYIQASEGGRQLDIENEEQLMAAYLKALLEKEISQLPEDSPQRWQTDVALNFVLPALAAEVRKKGHALTERQLLKITQTCWKILHSRTMRSVFPQWIGHSKEIFQDAENAEQWLGIILYQLLWQRLGILVKDAEGRYHIFHQIIEGYLAKAYTGTARRIRRRRQIIAAVWSVSLTCILLIFSGIADQYIPHNDKDIEKSIEWCTDAYLSLGQQYQLLKELSDSITESETGTSGTQITELTKYLSGQADLKGSEELYVNYIQAYIVPEGTKNVSWSQRPFEIEMATDLLNYTSEYAGVYGEVLQVLDLWTHFSDARSAFPDFSQLFSQALEANADYVCALYQQSCGVHINSGRYLWADAIRKDLTSIPGLEERRLALTPEESVESLHAKKEDLHTTLYGQALEIVAFLEKKSMPAESEGPQLSGTSAETESGSTASIQPLGWVTMAINNNISKNRFSELRYKAQNNYSIPDEILQEAITVGADAYQTFTGYCLQMSDIASHWLAQKEYEKESIDLLCSSLHSDEVPSYDVYRFLYRLQQGWIPYKGQDKTPFRLDLLSETNETSDKIVSWSYMPFNWDALETLLNYTSQRSGYYQQILPILATAMDTGNEETVQLFVDTVQKEMAVAEELYFLSCHMHCKEDNPHMPQWESSIPAVFPSRKRTLEQGDPEQLTRLQEELQTLVSAMDQKLESLKQPLPEENPFEKALENLVENLLKLV